MEEHILTTLKILIIGESGVGKSRLVKSKFNFILYMCGQWKLYLDGLLVIETCYRSDEYCFISFVFIV